MHHSALIGQLAGLVAISTLVPYVRSIFKGITKPNRATWLIWACVQTVLLASYHSSGATTTIWLAASFTAIPIIVFLLSIKYGVGGYKGLDIFCLTGAAIGLLLWKLTDSPELTLYINIFVDFLGFLPTIKKTYLQPGTEDTLAWAVGTLATILNVFALTTWELKIAVYPVYLLITNMTVTILATGKLQERLNKQVSNK